MSEQKQPLFDVAALKKLDAKPGDTFVLEVPAECIMDELEVPAECIMDELEVPAECIMDELELQRLSQHAKFHLNGAKVLVTQARMKLREAVKVTNETGLPVICKTDWEDGKLHIRVAVNLDTKKLAALFIEVIEAQRTLMQFVRYDLDHKPDSDYLPNRLLRAAMELDPQAPPMKNAGMAKHTSIQDAMPDDPLDSTGHPCPVEEPEHKQTWRDRPPML